MRGVTCAAVFGLLVWGAGGACVELTGTIWDRVGQRVGVDPALAYSVGLVETAKLDRARHGVRPSPYAVRASCLTVIGADLEEGRAALRRALGCGSKNIDIGLMQVNLGWNGGKVADPADLLDPEKNLIIGMTALRDAMASAKDDPQLGIGRYHNWSDEVRAREYGRAVLVTYHKLKNNEQ